MIIAEIKNIVKTPKEFKKFGITVGVVLMALSILLSFLGGENHIVLYLLSAVFLGLAFLYPAGLKYPYIIWMTIAIVLGFISTNIILFTLFFLIIFPISLLSKAAGKRYLETEFKTNLQSYWIIKDPDLTGKNSEKQY